MSDAQNTFRIARSIARLTGEYSAVVEIAGRRIYVMHGYPEATPPQRCGCPGHIAMELNAAAHYRRAGCGSSYRVDNLRVRRQYLNGVA